MATKVVLLIAFCAFHVDAQSTTPSTLTTPKIEKSDLLILDFFNAFRERAASGDMTKEVHEFAKNMLVKINDTKEGQNNKTKEMLEIMYFDVEGRLKTEWGPMSNVQLLAWNNTLKKLTESNECPEIGGNEVIWYHLDTNYTHREVVIPLNYTDEGNPNPKPNPTVVDRIGYYFEYFIKRMSVAHPTLIMHTNFIIGEFYFAKREEIGCSVNTKCPSEARLVCRLSPGMEFTNAFLTGAPGSECPMNYVNQSGSNLCMINPNLTQEQIFEHRELTRQGYEPIVLVPQEKEPDGVRQVTGLFLISLIVYFVI